MDLEKAEFGLKFEEIEAERAKQRHESQRGEDGKYQPLGSNEPKGEEVRARTVAARKIGLSPTTYHKAKTILERGSEKLINKVKKGGEADSFFKLILMASKWRSVRGAGSE